MVAIPTSLLKAVAEAAVAYRTGTDVYVAAQLEYPHDREVFYTYDGASDPRVDAETFMESKGRDWTLLGPYVTERELPLSEVTANNFKITIEGTDASGEHFVREIDSEVDAIFLTLPAIDKFVVPYYTHLYGAERALELRNQVTTTGMNLPCGNHVWNSKFIPL